jgi:hypothetical protein
MYQSDRWRRIALLFILVALISRASRGGGRGTKR